MLSHQVFNNQMCKIAFAVEEVSIDKALLLLETHDDAEVPYNLSSHFTNCIKPCLYLVGQAC